MSSDNSTETATWKRSMPRTQDQLDSLQTAADDLARSRTIDVEERVEAVETATQLAETLGSSGLEEAAVKARDVLATLQHPGLPQPERLHQQVGALRESLDQALED